MAIFEPVAWRGQFPFFEKYPECIYLDNAATTQRLRSVVERMVKFYYEENSNVHRGVYDFSEWATLAYESARHAAATYLNAYSGDEIIFTGGTTDALNTVAFGLGESVIRKDDEILITAMEHHSNILPWKAMADRKGARLCIADLTPSGEIDVKDFDRKLSLRTRVVAVAHVSNVLGTINPVGDIVGLAKKVGAYTVIDGAQWPSAGLVDVRSLGCDFYAFSAHKVFGPMGVGILYGRQEVLNKISPFRFGGGMVQKVTAREVVYRDLPERLEGGTPNVAGAVALPCMFEFLGSIDWPGYRAHEQRIRSAIEDGMHKIPGLRLLGTAADKVGIYAFSHPNIHAHDLASLLASQHICVRAGNHCAQLLLPHFNISQSLRASFSIYNTVEEAGQFMTALGDAIRFLR